MYTHETEIRMRYQETDNMGVVYYANYFVWFEVARSEFFRSLGISYSRLEADGNYLMVVSARCEYKHPARYDDIVKVESWISKARNSSLEFNYRLYVDKTLIAVGESAHVFTDSKRKATKIPREIKDIITRHSAQDTDVIAAG
jgi:acyl-CoA thioester hydrolase